MARAACWAMRMGYRSLFILLLAPYSFILGRGDPEAAKGGGGGDVGQKEAGRDNGLS